jgi:hypothetical protein
MDRCAVLTGDLNLSSAALERYHVQVKIIEAGNRPDQGKSNRLNPSPGGAAVLRKPAEHRNLHAWRASVILNVDCTARRCFRAPQPYVV